MPSPQERSLTRTGQRIGQHFRPRFIISMSTFAEERMVKIEYSDYPRIVVDNQKLSS